jgi:hypothetical protein
MTPTKDRVLISAFLVVICLPAIGSLLGWDRGFNRNQGREQLAQFPALTLDWPSVRAFPGAFTRYFEGNFAFRPRLVEWQSVLRFEALDASPSPVVVKGRDGWLFYWDDGAPEDYTNANPFTRDELEAWQRTLEGARDWLAARGIAYLFVIAPDKHVIYPEYMPVSIRPVRGESRIDQLVAHLGAHSTVDVLDLRPALLGAKAGERIYQRTDTHWNDRGAFVAYRQILQRLAPSLPGARPMDRSMFEAREVHSSGLDLAGMLGLTDSLREEDLRLVRRDPAAARVVEPLNPDPHGIEGRMATELRGGSLPRAVVFRDSFGSALIPFLSEHFSRTLYLWQPNFDPEAILEEHPAAVIQEWAGRHLHTLGPYDAVSKE